MRSLRICWVLGLLAEVSVLSVVSEMAGLSGWGWLGGLAFATAVCGLLCRGLRRSGTALPGPADWVTLSRAMLAGAVTGVVVDSFVRPAPPTALVALSVIALVLDGLDGYVARRTGTASALGARFDMEVDAALILVLSVYAADRFGGWVLAIGTARYAMWVAGKTVAWLCRPVPPRYWRKVVAAIQGIVLTVAAAAVLPRAMTGVALAGALALLAESFGHDVWWLARQRGIALAERRTSRRMVTAAHG